MNELKRRWRQLSLREQGLVLGCCALVIVSLCYSLLWLPWQQQASQWQRTIAREKSTVEWMLQQAPRLRQQGSRPAVDISQSLSATVAQSAAARKMNITRLQPQGERLAVTLEPSDFNTLMQWLTQLEQQHRVRIVALEVAMRPEQPGWVTVNKLTLERHDER
ncbi:general secretion pathway protein M [Serratia fonticola]|jgi:general secretion pathway protein M|uniref:Type II secretion system protein M n=1 Tax=Serratia fonticola TaxID=47917 RepID=A0A559TCW0_SERFO|nr:type II secretion system protein M [Serratia fonticola]TQI80027.1 general secretion pathway protein M [Serratia fonticola]TQI97947.1 general secretion pathway protein M [Serratia fonticola]TVZ72442.1 general secretion pathway protein M [Serratia fonticola]